MQNLLSNLVERKSLNEQPKKDAFEKFILRKQPFGKKNDKNFRGIRDGRWNCLDSLNEYVLYLVLRISTADVVGMSQMSTE